MIRKLGSTLLCVLVAMVACAANPKPNIPDPRRHERLPRYAVPVKGIPADYAVWFGEVQECVGGSRVTFQSIRWYAVVAGDTGFTWTTPYGNRRVAGLAYGSLNAIVMGDKWLLRPEFVRHELLHLIASPMGHNPDLYLRKCAHLVTCYDTCQTDTIYPR